jgi:hypothetical protein
MYEKLSTFRRSIMRSGWKRKLYMIVSFVALASLLLMGTASAASTTKNLSTNFTLVNIGTSTATVSLSYVLPDGSPWTGSGFTNLSIPPDGGQAIVRQYSDTLTPGSGSVVISSDQQLGSMVQILNRTGVPTSGAYTGFSSGSGTVLVPLVSKNGASSTGTANSQIIIQNAGSATTTVDIALTTLGAATPVYTKTGVSIAVGASFTYDLNDETNLTGPWWGSAVVTAAAGGQVAVITNLFFGADSLNSYEGVPIENITSKWFIPLLYSRLSNTLTTSVTIQNVSGGTIPVNDITLSCVKDAGSGGAATLTIPNNAAISDKGIYAYNAQTDTARFPANWYGGCTVSSATSKNIVVMVQYRYINTGDQGAYIAIPGNSTDKTLYAPLIAKRLANGFATTATIQNLNGTTDATVTLTYTPSGGGAPIVRTGVVIPAGGSIIRNFRLGGTELPEITNGWVGTLKVTSDQPIQAYLANTYITPPTGDQFMAYIGFTKP